MWLRMWNGKGLPRYLASWRATTQRPRPALEPQTRTAARAAVVVGAGPAPAPASAQCRVVSGPAMGPARALGPPGRGAAAPPSACPQGAKPKAAPRAGGGAVPGARKKSGIEFRLFVSYNSYERTTLEITAPARRRQQRRAWISDRIRELEQERLHSARGAWHRCLACELLQVQEPHHRTAA